MKRYWFCVVEVDLPQGVELPDGADNLMRNAVQVQAEAIRGVGNRGANVGEVFSGWGLNDKGARSIKLESIMPDNNR